MSSEARECAFCGRETEGSYVELRLYNGPGLKIGALVVQVCVRHLEALREANESDERLVPECRVARWERGRARVAPDASPMRYVVADDGQPG